jgi:hypothetical protein
MCGHRSRAHHRQTPQPRTAGVPADDLRASDAERERIIADLRDHAAAGRLTVEELDERTGAAYAAATRRQLAALLADLPRHDLPSRVAPRPRRDAGSPADHLRAYLVVMVALVAIWALTGAGYFWPVWPALGWGIGLVPHAFGAQRPRPGT